jgi:hypothetical protein
MHRQELSLNLCLLRVILADRYYVDRFLKDNFDITSNVDVATIFPHSGFLVH